jgi:hypothetical protein
VKDKLQRLVRQLVCAIVGHKPSLNGQQYEDVVVHRLNGQSDKERRLVEREWCGRCRKLLRVALPNKALEGKNT